MAHPDAEDRKIGHYSMRRSRGQRLLSRRDGFKAWVEEDREDTRGLGIGNVTALMLLLAVAEPSPGSTGRAHRSLGVEADIYANLIDRKNLWEYPTGRLATVSFGGTSLEGWTPEEYIRSKYAVVQPYFNMYKVQKIQKPSTPYRVFRFRTDTSIKDKPMKNRVQETSASQMHQYKVLAPPQFGTFAERISRSDRPGGILNDGRGVQPEGFVPVQSYSRVRKLGTVQRLPGAAAIEEAETPEEIANAPRLRQVVRRKKTQEISPTDERNDNRFGFCLMQGERGNASVATVWTYSRNIALHLIAEKFNRVPYPHADNGLYTVSDPEKASPGLKTVVAANFYEEGIPKLISQYSKCIDVAGDYVEK
ncbi:hypothetical protein AAG570_010991 [Ranatra chinensis]|uniref:Uncharacterized protein n=1 Tax=Ranatra chinensis TaxID=642074 RepID=A0ABD0YLG1_9HEMI